VFRMAPKAHPASYLQGTGIYISRGKAATVWH